MKKVISLTLSILFLATLASNLLAQENVNERFDGNVNYGEIMEDISVMARIIDKTLAGKFPGDYGSEKIGFFGGSSGCEDIYLKGYGVVFITDINFPVSAQKVEDKMEIKPDELWQQTKEEIEKGTSAPVAGTRVETWFKYGDAFIAYDSRKVEALKQELVSLTLAYGENIRNLNPQDNIVIVVKGPAQNSEVFAYKIGENDDVNVVDCTGLPNNITMQRLEIAPAQNVSVATSVAIPEIEKASSGTAPSDDAKKQLDEAKKKLEEAKSQMGVAQMEAAKAGAEVASSVAKQLATQKKEFNKQVSVVTSLKRNAKPSILTIKVTKEDITTQKNGRISNDEFMKRAEITQY